MVNVNQQSDFLQITAYVLETNLMFQAKNIEMVFLVSFFSAVHMFTGIIRVTNAELCREYLVVPAGVQVVFPPD